MLVRALNPFKQFLVLISLLYPRDSDLIVFGSGTGPFVDNPKYMFLQVAEKTDLRSVWISQDEEVVNELKERGYVAYKSDTLEAKLCSLRAGYAIIDHYISDLPSWYILGADIVNLWHGFPYKEIGDEEPAGIKEKFIYKYRDILYSEDYFLSTSRRYDFLFSGESDKERIYGGYPRNDSFSFGIPGSEIRAIEVEGNFVLYLPTFRDDSEFKKEVDLDSIDNILDDLDMKMVLKLHPREELSRSFDNIEVIESRIDIYPLLKQSSALITDYSSVMFDYMYTGNPIIRYQFDKDEYKKQRGLNEEVERLVPGKEVKEIDDLAEVLSNLEEINTDYQDKIDEVFSARVDGLQAPHILNQLD